MKLFNDSSQIHVANQGEIVNEAQKQHVENQGEIVNEILQPYVANQCEIVNETPQLHIADKGVMQTRNSNRHKKKPVTRTDDIYGNLTWY